MYEVVDRRGTKGYSSLVVVYPEASTESNLTEIYTHTNG